MRQKFSQPGSCVTYVRFKSGVTEFRETGKSKLLLLIKLQKPPRTISAVYTILELLNKAL
ncbi:11573_t:CDS:1, partial [Dentiscutata erythropus]